MFIWTAPSRSRDIYFNTIFRSSKLIFLPKMEEWYFHRCIVRVWLSPRTNLYVFPFSVVVSTIESRYFITIKFPSLEYTENRVSSPLAQVISVSKPPRDKSPFTTPLSHALGWAGNRVLCPACKSLD